MKKSEKLQLLIEDDKRVEQRKLLEEQKQLMEERKELEEIKNEIDSFINNPPTFNRKVDNPFQTLEVPNDNMPHEVYKLNIPDNKAMVITEIANEWYPRTTFILKVDGNKKEYQRTIADPENPTKVEMLASDEVTWVVENRGDESRHIGIKTDGHFIPQEIYDLVNRELEPDSILV